MGCSLRAHCFLSFFFLLKRNHSLLLPSFFVWKKTTSLFICCCCFYPFYFTRVLASAVKYPLTSFSSPIYIPGSCWFHPMPARLRRSLSFCVYPFLSIFLFELAKPFWQSLLWNGKCLKPWVILFSLDIYLMQLLWSEFYFLLKKKKIIAFLNLLEMSLELVCLCRYIVHLSTDNSFFFPKKHTEMPQFWLNTSSHWKHQDNNQSSSWQKQMSPHCYN